MDRPVLVLEDFNLPTIKWPMDGIETGYLSPVDVLFHESFADRWLSQYVHECTFIPSGNVLDLVLCSENDIIGEVSVSSLPNCHHAPMVV